MVLQINRKQNSVFRSEEVDDLEICPKCSRDKSLDVEILVGPCGHKLCRICVNKLYLLNTDVLCQFPSCKKKLKKQDYKIQFFNDLEVHKEGRSHYVNNLNPLQKVVLRAEVMKIYNKPRESFPPDANGLRQYNDYLENIEKIVFNLLSDVDVEKTQNEISKYKEEFQREIRLYSEKYNKEVERVKAEVEKEQINALQKEQEEVDFIKEKIKENEKENEDFIEALQTENLGSLKERLKNKEELKQRKKKSQNTAIGQSKSVKLKIPAEELVLYSYKFPSSNTHGPPVPDYALIKNHYQPAFTDLLDLAPPEHSVPCGFEIARQIQRSLSEAFNCLFFKRS